MNEIKAGICSTATLRAMVRDAETPYLILTVDGRSAVRQSPLQIDRMARVMSDTGAPMVYSDYYLIDAVDGAPTLCQVNSYLEGSVRDDFDFGHVVMVSREDMINCLATLPEYEYAGWYALRLALSRRGLPVHIPEPLYEVTEGAEATSQFDYVDPRNRKVQQEMEKAFTAHLHEVGAWLQAPMQSVEHPSDFPVEASVIIPVRNRVATVTQAIRSALSQVAPFSFNVIVVDNHSTDGTTEAISSIAENDDRLIHIVPEEKTLGIGGCWNKAVMHPECGRYAIQLDSDDLYADGDVIRRIVEKFQEEGSAMVVGSYRLTDFDLNPIPPGVIDHKEWTDDNGPNNALRINGLGAPRAFYTDLVRRFPFPDVSYGEDYAMALRLSRNYRVSRIYDVLYLCRRWSGNSDASLSREKANRFNHYKDTLRTFELAARKNID